MASTIEFTTELPCDQESICTIQHRIEGVLDDLGFPASDKIKVRLAVDTAIGNAVGINGIPMWDRRLMLECAAHPDSVRIEIYGTAIRDSKPVVAALKTNSHFGNPPRNGDRFLRAVMSVVNYDSRSRLVLEKHPGSQLSVF